MAGKPFVACVGPSMVLDRASLVQTSLCCEVGRMREFGRREAAKIVAHTITLDGGSPSARLSTRAFHLADSEKAAPVRRIRSAHVFGILMAPRIAQVYKSVVVPDSIDVVNLAGRPHPVNVEPRQSVSPEVLLTGADDDVSEHGIDGAETAAHWRLAELEVVWRNAPEKSSVGIVSVPRPKFFERKVGGCHGR
jgi:hypothetical protein